VPPAALQEMSNTINQQPYQRKRNYPRLHQAKYGTAYSYTTSPSQIFHSAGERTYQAHCDVDQEQHYNDTGKPTSPATTTTPASTSWHIRYTPFRKQILYQAVASQRDTS
jgi:hypothetical protein